MVNKKVFYLVMSVFLISIVLGTCSNRKVDEKATAQKVITDFFDLYSQEKYDEMKKLTTDKFSEDFLYNLQNGMFGMKSIKLTECVYNEHYSKIRADSGILAFSCQFNMIPSEISAYGENETEAFFYIEVKKENEVWKICDCYTG